MYIYSTCIMLLNVAFIFLPFTLIQMMEKENQDHFICEEVIFIFSGGCILCRFISATERERERITKVYKQRKGKANPQNHNSLQTTVDL